MRRGRRRLFIFLPRIDEQQYKTSTQTRLHDDKRDKIHQFVIYKTCFVWSVLVKTQDGSSLWCNSRWLHPSLWQISMRFIPENESITLKCKSSQSSQSHIVLRRSIYIVCVYCYKPNELHHEGQESDEQIAVSLHCLTVFTVKILYVKRIVISEWKALAHFVVLLFRPGFSYWWFT